MAFYRAPGNGAFKRQFIKRFDSRRFQATSSVSKQLQAVPGGQAGKSTLAGNKKFISNSQNLMKSEKVHVQY